MISEETRRKLIESHRGKHPSEITRQRLSDAHSGEKNHFFGKRHTPESIEKMKKSHCGQVVSQEHREKLRIRFSGTGSSTYGKPRSEETRRKLKEAAKKQFENPETHYNWQGGISFEPYCSLFNREFKERVRTFFGHQCVECGTPQSKKKLIVHHVNFNKKTCCDETIPLFVSLCRSCHTKTNFNRKYWEQHFTEIINIYYQGRCYLSVNEMQQLVCAVEGAA
jgi:hypothetical protein